jgi:hypothetical protein
MGLATLIAILRLSLLVILGLLAGLVLRGILSGNIKTRGLVSHGEATGWSLAPERLAALLATCGYGAFYVLQALRMPLDGLHPALPDIPDDVLAVLLGTNGVYLTRKFVVQRGRRI